MQFNWKKFLKSIFNDPDRIAFKIIDVLHSQISSLIKIRYQVIGKSSISTESVGDIYRDLASIQGFSKKDSSLILEAYNLEKNSPDFILISIVFDAHDPVFIIKDKHSDSQFSFSTNFINMNKEILKLFSIKDTNKILHVIFDSIYAKEKEEINFLKKQLKKNNLNIVSL